MNLINALKILAFWMFYTMEPDLLKKNDIELSVKKYFQYTAVSFPVFFKTKTHLQKGPLSSGGPFCGEIFQYIASIFLF